ncbi:hypothetical protein AOLI_G00099810 [Acnodon oligacanthus]
MRSRMSENQEGKRTDNQMQENRDGSSNGSISSDPENLHFNRREAVLNDQPLAVAPSAHPVADTVEPASVKEVRKVKIRRVNVIQDMEAYTAFWEEFLEHCEGEEERVPRLRPDYSEKEWAAAGVPFKTHWSCAACWEAITIHTAKPFLMVPKGLTEPFTFSFTRWPAGAEEEHL